MTIREFISLVRNDLNSLSPDTYISGEWIYFVAIHYAKLYTKRESDSRKIFKNTSMFKYIDCFKMTGTSVNNCTDIKLPCNSIAKSVIKLPELYTANYGSLLLVYTLDRSKDYIETNPISYKSIGKQKYKPKDKGYFWINDGYLFIPDSEVEAVSIMYLSASIEDITKNSCKFLDNELPILDHLVIAVIESTVKHILTSKSIPLDENPNLNART